MKEGAMKVAMHRLRRRAFLRRAILMGAAGLSAVGTHGWAWKSSAQVAATSPRLIVILLRGAVDGLSVLVPYQEADYYAARPRIAIAKPGEKEGAIDLNGQFGLHPALEPLMAQWNAGNLAFVQATGLKDTSRSHFQAQDYLESGHAELNSSSGDGGWLNRLVGVLPGGNSTQAVSISNSTPLILTGPQSVASMAFGRAGSREMQIDKPQIQAVFDRLYAQDERLSRIYQEGREARDVLLRSLNEERIAASKGAPAPDQFETSARYLADLMLGEAATQVAFMELGGWDSHVNQRGLLNRQLQPLGKGLAVLAEALGPVYENTAIVVMSEFGRKVAENGNGGTDHGYGNAMWLLGGAIEGKRLHGEWPGLAKSVLHESRDLAITTDARDVLRSLLAQHFSLDNRALSQVFPGHQQSKTLQLV